VTLGKGARWNKRTKWFKFRRYVPGGGGKVSHSKEGTAPTLAAVMQAYHAWIGTPVGGVPTFREFVESGWVDAQDIAGMKPSTREFYANALCTLLPRVGERALTSFTAAGIESLALELQREGRSPTTARSYAQVILRILRAAVGREAISELPVKRRVQLPKAAKPQNVLTPEQEAAFFAAMTSEFHALAVTARHTGLRKSDLVALRWADIDLTTATIAVTQCKTSSVVIVPILQATSEALDWCRHRSVRSKDGIVFLDRRGRPWTKQTIKDQWAAAKRRAGLSSVAFRFHDLRHAHGTAMAEANLELPVIAAMLGHKDLKSSQRYLHPRAEVLVERARAALEGAAIPTAPAPTPTPRARTS